MKVLISGIAGDIGFGIARILKEWNIFSELHGIDIHSDHPGCLVLDKCVIAPRANEEIYIKWLTNYIGDNQIDIFIPSSEAEISVLTSAGLYKLAGAKILRNTDFTIQKSLDKFECLSYLSSKGITVPKNGLIGDTSPTHYPVIVKPRSGQGSKGVKVVHNEDELNQCLKNWVWQEYLFPDDEEYTCAIYKSTISSFRSLILKRKLVGGSTGSGIVIENSEIEKYIHKIAEAMQINGAINIQLRLTKQGPLLFEINPRLSSTLVFRDKMGFTDLRWWLADILKLKTPEYHAPKSGIRFYRCPQEYIEF